MRPKLTNGSHSSSPHPAIKEFFEHVSISRPNHLYFPHPCGILEE